MRSGCYCRVTWLVVLLLFSNDCFSGALPKHNDRMNKSVAKVIQFKLNKMGIAANDPCFNATVSSVGSGVFTLAASLSAGASWPLLLAKVGVSALTGYVVPLAVDKSIDWLFKDDGNIVVNEGIPSELTLDNKTISLSNDGSFVLPDNFDINKIPVFPFEPRYHVCNLHKIKSNTIYIGNKYSVFPYVLYFTRVRHFGLESYYLPGAGTRLPWVAYSAANFGNDTAVELIETLVFHRSLSNSNKFFLDKNHVSDVKDIFSNTFSVADAINNTSPNLLQQQLSPEMLTLAANIAWRAVDSEDETGRITWSPNDPITPQDVQQWLAGNAKDFPTVRDFFSPVVSVQIPPSFSSAAARADSHSVLNVDSARAVNFSKNYSNEESPECEESSERRSRVDSDEEEVPDESPRKKPDPDPDEEPDTSPPELEGIPTARMILEPILNLMSDLKNFSVPSHISVCPVASFTAFGKEYHFQVHCDLIEQHRSLIETIMVLAWALIALGIVLRA